CSFPSISFPKDITAPNLFSISHLPTHSNLLDADGLLLRINHHEISFSSVGGVGISGLAAMTTATGCRSCPVREGRLGGLGGHAKTVKYRSPPTPINTTTLFLLLHPPPDRSG
ncbi:hypothetical protein LINPERPRIM_LOCUS2565, partial [Linum perenne]